MKLDGKVVVVTGGGNGIGRALCQRFSAEGTRGIVVADIDEARASDVATEVGGVAVTIDVAQEADMHRLVEVATRAYGTIDLFCSNAGIVIEGGIEVAAAEWQRIWEINVMAHVWAARAVVPLMMKRGAGYLLQTVSAAGLLTAIESAPYSVTKHAALGFAEWLSITYGHAGLKVSCICPQGVRTKMLLGDSGDRDSYLLAGAIEPEQVAEAAVRGIDEERFLILPHAQVAEYFQRKASDYDRWLRGMRRLRTSALGA